ncbi:laminin subunit beta-4-like [Trichomycterus rosablanca]|uniref:laminin subunit beta-4-like n=1 Tax=Trichomycterus rosablanca TaxID=2290929 RepID=UPI002F35140E
MGGEVMSALLLLVLVVPAYFQDECDGNLCYPSLGDLMVGRAAQLSATSTCGLNGPQNYCILGYLEDEQKCFVCDSRSPYNLHNNHNSHQVDNIITNFEPERKMRWWQSENGVHQVSVQLDLETVFQFSHMVLTFKSFRPAAMLVERSKDFGRTWKVLRYFSVDCASDFPRISEGPAEAIDDLICDTRYSGAEPSTEGEVVFKALDPNFHIDDPYDPTIQELITMTNLRVNFTRLLTLGDDLLGRKRRYPQEKYYYSLYEMVVRGSCFCNGHASQCMPVDGTRGDTFNQPGMIHGRCTCEHNTMGNNCEKCQPFYNDAPWRPATITDPHVCRKCNCNGHSESCHFDLEHYLATGQTSGGVCDDCRNNRMGAQCELCSPRFYQDPLRSVDDPYSCIPCNCDPVGSVDGGLCDSVTGHCVCKENVEGERCDRCRVGFYGLEQEDPSGCQACMCNFLGTVRTSPCDQNTGQCICELFASGLECDQCLPGYWGLGNTVHGCAPCDCDIGGAFNTMCSLDNGQCQCRANMVGRSCSEPAPGFFLAPFDFYLYEAENAVPLDSKCPTIKPTRRPYCPPAPSKYPTSAPVPTKPAQMPNCADYFRSKGFDVYFRDGRFVVVKRESRRKRRQDQRTISLQPGSAHEVILRSQTPDGPITWTGPGFVQVQDGAGLRFTVTNIPLSLNYNLVIRYEPQSTDDWKATVKFLPLESTDESCPYDPNEKTLTLPSTGRAATLDTPLCVSFGVRYYVDITFEKQDNPDCSSHILIDSVGLLPKIESLPNFCSDTDLAQYQHYDCEKLGAQAGERTLPEVCERLFASISAYIHNGAISCRCNSEGSLSSVCKRIGGQCDCKPNVVGRCCDTCAPLTYGFGSDGCFPCDCDPAGSKDEYCDSITGQCPCHNQFTGRQCNQCMPGFYDFPNCKRCQCNGLANLCDQITGVCLNCREHSTGPNCERCEEGYFGDPVSREPCKPCSCPDLKGSGRFFASTCHKDPNSVSLTCVCETGHEGLRCDKCAPGYFGNLILPGARCKKCSCNNNIDPSDPEACDTVTGDCRRCLYNTAGPQCQNCKPGYYGNALLQDCKQCSCDPKGTIASKCPQGSPCLCDQVTGKCPCRTGVVGVLCDRCADGYWNMTGSCQPCNCDVANSLNNVCDKVTGQCTCETGYGGKQCEKCAANHFGNPDIQCMPCECNMEGSVYPGCDPETGDCICRPGVVGYFCDKCAPGHDPTFPTCEPCSSCYQQWEKNFTNIFKSTEKMLSLTSKLGGKLELSELKLQGKINQLKDKLMNVVKLLRRDPDMFGGIKNLLNQIRDTMDNMDTDIVIIDPSKLLNTDIDNIHYEFKKLLDKLQKKVQDAKKIDIKSINDGFQKIRKLHANFLKDETRVNNAKKKLDASMQTRQDAKRELAKCEQKPLDELEKKVKDLSVAKLNEEICGAQDDKECKKVKCEGALCGLCGWPSCTGSLPIIRDTFDTAKKTETGIRELLRNLTDAETKIKEVKKTTRDVKDKANGMRDKITKTKDKLEKEKDSTKRLIKRISDYLKEDALDPEDINKVASAVLAIKLPKSPDEIKKMIEEIQRKMGNFTQFNEDLKKLEDQAKLAKDLKDKANEILDKTKDIDVSDIEKILKDTTKLHDKIKPNLDQTENNIDAAKDLIDESLPKLANAEENLSPTPAKKLQEEIEALKDKTEMNRAQALDAKKAAGAALVNATDAKKNLKEVEEQLKKLKNNTQDVSEDIKERLMNITKEAEDMAKDVENKKKLIEDLEKRIQDSIESKNDKMIELESLMTEAEDLWKNISESVAYYLVCTT